MAAQRLPIAERHEQDEWFRCTQILLSTNQLSSLSESFRGQEIRSWLLNGNKHITKIPKLVIGSMILLQSLNLSLSGA